MTPVPADGFTQLALHFLAHVPRRGPADLYDPGHVRRSAPHFSAAARALVEADARALARMWTAELDVVDALPELHASLAAYRRTSARALAELGPADVASPALLAALQRAGAAAELLHASLSLLALEFEAALAAVVEPALEAACAGLRAPLEALSARAPGLGEARVEVVWSLGSRGRALPGRILIGRPAEDPLLPAIVAAHEHAVCTSGQEDYFAAEWSALVRLSGWLVGAAPELREAQARWLAGLDLAPILAAAVAAGWLAATDAERVAREPGARGELLARCASPRAGRVRG